MLRIKNKTSQCVALLIPDKTGTSNLDALIKPKKTIIIEYLDIKTPQMVTIENRGQIKITNI